MSAWLLVRQGDSGHLLTDACEFDAATGRLTGVASRVWRLNTTPAASVVTVRGERGAILRTVDLVMEEAARHGRIDAIAAALPSISKAIGDVEILVAGWLAGAARAWAVTAADGHGATPHVLIPITKPIVGNPVPVDHIPPAVEDFDIDRDGLAWFDALRKTPMRHAMSKIATGYCAVGAMLEATAVGPDGVATRLVYTWPDRIGEPMNSEAA